MSENEADKALARIEETGRQAVVEFVERGVPLPDVLDLEIALAGLPKVNEWLKRAMTFKGRAEMIVEQHLKTLDARQRIYGATAFGLKSGGWVMSPTDAETLLAYLLPYAGTDFTQGDLDAAIRHEGVYVSGVCAEHGPYEVAVACKATGCGVVMERLVVNHTGLNKIEKVARAEVKRRLDGVSPETLRRRGEPSLELKPAR